MKLPRLRDFTELQRAILALHSHRDLRSFRKAVPGIFLGLIRADYFSLVDARVNMDKRVLQVLDLWESRPLSVGKLGEAIERNSFDHPFTRHGEENGVHRAMMLSDYVTLPQLRRTRLYREALRPANIGRMLSIGSFGGPGLAALNLARAESAPNFTERDRLLLESIRPHFEQARQNLQSEAVLRARRSLSAKAIGFTPREAEVALWLAQGKTNPEIANILATPRRTVEKHVERILQKLGVANRASAAVAMAGIIRG